MVHRNVSLDAITKFHYLQSALTGGAKEYISSFEVTSENYAIVLDLLKKRYHNPHLIIKHHVQQLFNLPQVTRDSANSLRALSDGLQKHTRVLEQLKEPVSKWDTLLIYLAANKLDINSKREWELKVVSEKLSKLSEFINFVEIRSQMLDAIAPNTYNSNHVNKQGNAHSSKRETHSLSHLSTGLSNLVCAICNQDHRIYSCSIFGELSVNEKRNKTKELNLCFNCLGVKHTAKECKSSRLCKHCNGKHHSLLHLFNDSNLKQGVEIKNNNSNQDALIQTSVSMIAHKDSGEKLLSTVIVFIQNKQGKLIKARALLDNGSMPNIMTKELCNKLELKESHLNHTISGLDLMQTKISTYVTTTIQSTQNDYKIRTEFFITNNISYNIPTKNININKISIPTNIQLADPNFHTPQPIDLLLGTSIFWDCLEPQQIKQHRNHPVLQLTKFGWILGGQLNCTQEGNQTKSSSTFCGLISDSSLNKQLEKFWTINEESEMHPRSAEERECERIFSSTVSRESDDRFVVDMLLKRDPCSLGDSRSSAENRLRIMERRFQRDPKLKERYQQFIEEYINLGHMTLIPDDENGSKNYLPHHGVTREESTTTKLRVVFDGSSKTSSRLSLNDCLMVGPTVQPELFDIILRFRQHRYVLTGDITKMYRQIWIRPDQRKLQCILWRDEASQSMKSYQLNTVTYGLASSPFLAIRCLQKLADDHQETHPLASRVIKQDFYVDDMLTGGDSESQIRKIKTDVMEILKSAKFELQKIHSNVENMCNQGEEQEITEIKTLGLTWQPSKDVLKFRTTYDGITNDNVTKRTILSIISQIFDPLGLLGPFTMKSKLLLQHLWKLKLDWDSPIPPDLRSKWKLHCDQLRSIGDIDIPRHAIIPNHRELQIHGFSDASEKAYGACIYIRSIDQTEKVQISLLCARSRVAPLKSVSLPRLELCGAVLLASLFVKVKKALSLNCESYFWTDSMIALAWIKGEPSRWQTFVSNRVAEIQGMTEADKWNHVPTKQNPADLLSRGSDWSELTDSELWWNGPSWLKQERDAWPCSKIVVPEIPETKKLSFSFITVKKDFSVLRRYSSWNKLRRIMAYCLRFKANALSKLHGTAKNSEHITVEELSKATKVLVRLHQEEEFHRDISHLRLGKSLETSSELLPLNPFLDEEGLMRVGGRLSQAPISFSQRFPLILSKNHALTDMIIRDAHYRSLHAGNSLLLATLRENYWILRAKSAIRRVLSKCILCFKRRPTSPSQLMGDLPITRVAQSRVFAHTGLDYAGPFNIKLSRNKTRKAYLCLFVCMAVKAVHLELVSDLTTDSFLNALKRFIARRGKCISISSDNGKNFVGANNELKRIVCSLSESESKSKILEFALDNSIDWKFIPPQSPHMGGLWEATVKSAKSHLKAVMKETLFTFEELYTIIVQVEAILNSRPLYPLSSDPSDLNVLTPGHFLVGTALNSILEESALDIPVNRTNRFQLMCKIQQSFWKRWSLEYLTQLQARSKWRSKNVDDVPRVGQLILIRDDNLPPLRWQLGRISEVHPGADGLVRVVSIKTKSGILKRSLPKICVLPLDT